MSASPAKTLKLALAKGLQDAGVDVLDIGVGTEEIYFATFHLGVDTALKLLQPRRWITTA